MSHCPRDGVWKQMSYSIIISEEPSSMIVMQVTCLQWLYIIHTSWTKSYVLQLRSVASVMRIHFVHIMNRKLHLHDGTFTTNPDKNRLVGIHSRSGKPPDVRIDTDSVSASKASTSSKECKMPVHANCTCTRGMHVWSFYLSVASKWRCVGNFVASENRHSCQYADWRGQDAYYSEKMSFDV